MKDKNRETGGGMVMLALLLIGLFFAANVRAAAPDLKMEVSTGQCRYQPSPDGMWYQSEFDNPSKYKDNGCGEIGISGKFNHAYGWSLRYANLGRAHTRARAVTCENDDCDKSRDWSKDFRRADCGPAFNPDNCEYQWNGDGGVKGLNFSISREVLKLGRVSLEGEAGVLLYELKWNEQVMPLGCSDGNCPWRITVDQESGYAVSPMGGLTARLQLTEDTSVFLGTRVYLRTSQHLPISAGVSGNVQCWLAGVSTSF